MTKELYCGLVEERKYPFEMVFDSIILGCMSKTYLRVCLRVCLLPISSGTAGPIWLNFFLLAPSWLWGGFRPKKSGSGIRFFRKSGKTRTLGCYLTNLDEFFKIYSP